MLSRMKYFLTKSRPLEPILETASPCIHPACIRRLSSLKSDKSEAEFSLNVSFSCIDSIVEKAHAEHVETSLDVAWDFVPELGWAEFCLHCHQRRCPTCERQIFRSVSGFKDVLTFEMREVRICTPCVLHRMCPGWRLKIECLCETCGQGFCGGCGIEDSGGTYCVCNPGGKAWELHGVIEDQFEGFASGRTNTPTI